MQIDINFASQPYRQVQHFLLRWRLILGAATVVALGLACAAAAAYVSWSGTQKQAAELRAQIQEQRRIKAEAEEFLNRPENRELRTRAEILNSTIARKALSWTELFTELERVMPTHLHVTSIRPKVNRDGQFELQLTVVGSTSDAGTDLVRRLEQSPHFAQAQLKDEDAQPGPPTGELFRYTITAVYIPDFVRKLSAAEQQRVAGSASASPQLALSSNLIAKEQPHAGH